ncbi:GIY-YIG nuclease family protein [Thiocystis violacea]|uniref:GIY-YIG nuclease family protein n=1 Tax=Thiocystis violacea TaxID=13725 RepID=UPI001906586F|nr:GIY-YIG nuclease family protein [Thiocystis violacea]MBK1721379.1 hypothetical protein [Thiocystis violacea]
MATLHDAKNAIEDYLGMQRGLPELDISDYYALFPDTARDDIAICGRWDNDQYPHQDKPGVYLIFDEDLELMYIGKTDSTFGSRLYTYFKGTDVCKIVHPGWSRKPCYVATIPIEKSQKHIVSPVALEDYLIDRLQPYDNTRGIR